MFDPLKIAFDEIPALVINGITVASVAGDALVEYDRDGGFAVIEIRLDGTRDKTAEELRTASDPWTFIRDHVALPETDPLYATIKDGFEREYRGRIFDEIEQAIESEHALRFEAAAEHRREIRAGA